MKNWLLNIKPAKHDLFPGLEFYKLVPRRQIGGGDYADLSLQTLNNLAATF